MFWWLSSGKYIWPTINGWEYYPWKSAFTNWFTNRDKWSFATKQSSLESLLGDLFPPCHRRRNVVSNVFIELITVGIDTNTVVINYRREEGGWGTTWVKPGDFLRTIFGLLGRFLVTPLGLLWNHFVGAWWPSVYHLMCTWKLRTTCHLVHTVRVNLLSVDSIYVHFSFSIWTRLLKEISFQGMNESVNYSDIRIPAPSV